MTADYTVQTKQKFKRIGLASCLCGIAACVLVALLGGALAAAYYFFTEQVKLLPSPETGIMLGLVYGMLASMMNWVVGYITIPITILILFFTIGRMPRRGITYRLPYLKWTLIIGAVLVGSVCAIGTPLFSSMNNSLFVNQSVALVMIGAGISGFTIGVLSGLIIGWLFYAIVRPAEQVRTIDASVF